MSDDSIFFFIILLDLMNQSLKLEELARTTLPDSRDVFALSLQQGNPAVLKWCYGFGVQLGMKFFLTLITQS